MKHLINTTYLSNSQKHNENVELSSSCPCCGVSLLPDLLYAVSPISVVLMIFSYSFLGFHFSIPSPRSLIFRTKRISFYDSNDFTLQFLLPASPDLLWLSGCPYYFWQSQTLVDHAAQDILPLLSFQLFLFSPVHSFFSSPHFSTHCFHLLQIIRFSPILLNTGTAMPSF